ncbi:LysE family translocator [Klebsiella variicola subsp. variicola]|uniref:LysE family translocator n=1 Tax=Klebsiella variicola TaxID=244366 RepID=UPI0007A61E90|nr:LysE family translocator [Klebsiella variicola]MCB8422394.1 LysE family translocator [Klebsiella variicola subsp. variicola]MCB8442437.1 LysE family translocator [Klebsiella variicola subsp. variicola]MCB8496136.1 LysE family translocator [Klebsiella variicola subsp. variicola]MDM8774428.1 LysE family translocator [Klebsiella variicola]SXE61872.1 Homoserine/homoserine lactone efflux protein [Klebsiella variicola]
MQQIAFYILIASLTIASPGPGVLLTLTNTLNYNLRNAIAGIIGVAAGMGVISIVAASSVGVIITTSQLALLIVKVAGAAYLIYLGIKLFRSVPRVLNNNPDTMETVGLPSAGQRFRQELLVSLLNPKPIVFFMALFPQFIDPQQPFVPQFSILSGIFCFLVVVIHSLYGLFAHSVKMKMSSGNIFRKLNKTGGVVFMCFAAGLIVSALHPYI